MQGSHIYLQIPAVDNEHRKYHAGNHLHEAGYDSLLTAQILVRLSTQLHNEGALLKKPEKSAPTYGANVKASASPEGTSIVGFNGSLDGNFHGKKDSRRNTSISSSVGSALSIDSANSKKVPSQRPINWKEPTEVTRIRSAFAHQTKFDLLTDQTEEIVTIPRDADAKENSPSPVEESTLLSFQDELALERQVRAGRLIPRFSSDFWAIYSNKLRVFGTVETVCDLSHAAYLNGSGRN
jgi:poly(A)-specific ribonuclease